MVAAVIVACLMAFWLMGVELNGKTRWAHASIESCELVSVEFMDKGRGYSGCGYNWEQELQKWVNNPPLAKDRRVSSSRNVLAKIPTTTVPNTNVIHKRHLKQDFLLHLLLAAMVDLVADNTDDSGRKKAMLQQLFIRCGWIPAIYLSDSFFCLRNSIKNMLTSYYSSYLPETNLKIDNSLLGRQIRLSPFASSRYQSDFEELALIGRGGFGKVYLVRSRIDNCKYAVKKIPITLKKNEPMIKAINEVRLLASLQHKNIVRYYSAWAEFDVELRKVKQQLRITEVKDSDILVNNESSDKATEKEVTKDSDQSWLVSSDRPNNGAPTKGRFWRDDESESVSDSHSTQTTSPEYSTEAEATGRFVDSLPNAKACVLYRNSKVPKATMYVQMELCSRTLDDYLKERALGTSVIIDRFFNENIIHQLASALTYIHKKNIIHRDVKPCNLFMCYTGAEFPRLLLGDFGLACHDGSNSYILENDMLRNGNTVVQCHTAGVGTVLYSAPEQSSEDYDTSVDIYSAGIVIFELYSAFATVMERNEKIFALRNGLISEKFKDDWPIEAKLILSMCHHDPLKRPRAFEVSSYVESIEKQSVDVLRKKLTADREVIGKLERRIASLEAEIRSLKVKRQK